MNNRQAKNTTTLRRIFLLALVLLIAAPLITISCSTWFVYTDEVQSLENQSQETKKQIAQLARQSLLTLLHQIALVLGQNDPKAPELERLPIQSWEMVSADGTVLFSSLHQERVGKPSKYPASWKSVTGWSNSIFDVSGVVTLPTLDQPTVLLRVKTNAGSLQEQYRVAIIDPHYLHLLLTSQFESFVNRHVYVIDSSGRPIFYSDMELITQPGHFANNPPILHFLKGRKGPIRYKSTISGRERFGYVLRIEETGWGLIVSTDISSRMLDIHKRYLWVLATLLASSAFALVIFGYLNRRVIKPIRMIARDIRRSDPSGQAQIQLPPAGSHIREFQTLVDDFNLHAEQTKHAEQEVIQAEKLATIGELTAGLAHEIGTPLNVMRGNAQLLIRKMEADAPEKETLEKIILQTSRIADLIRSLLDLARLQDATQCPVSLMKLLDKVINTIREMYPSLKMEVRLEDNLPKVLGISRNLEHAFLNLMVNAAQAMEEDGTLRVFAKTVSEAKGSFLQMEVEDDGCGIQPGDLSKIFQPFFSTKASGKGTGLGLALVDRVVKQHGGSITVRSQPGSGTLFTLLFPVYAEEEVDGDGKIG